MPISARSLRTVPDGILRRLYERAATEERLLGDELREALRRVPTGEGSKDAHAQRGELVARLVNAARDVGACEVLLDEYGEEDR